MVREISTMDIHGRIISALHTCGRVISTIDIHGADGSIMWVFMVEISLSWIAWCEEMENNEHIGKITKQ